MSETPAEKLRHHIKSEVVKNKYDYGICNYGFANDTCASSYPQLNAGCFAYFPSALTKFLIDSKDEPAKYFVSHAFLFRRSEGTPERHAREIKYLTWLANESPFSDIFITKDAEDMLANGEIYSCDWSKQALLQAAISCRIIREYPKTLENWELMIDAGLSPLDAFTLMLFNINQQSNSFSTTINGLHNLSWPTSDQMLARLNSGNKKYLNRKQPVSQVGKKGTILNRAASEYAWLKYWGEQLTYIFELDSSFSKQFYVRQTIKSFGQQFEVKQLPKERIGEVAKLLISQIHKLKATLGVENAV